MEKLLEQIYENKFRGTQNMEKKRKKAKKVTSFPM